MGSGSDTHVPIRKFLENCLMEDYVSDPKRIRNFLGCLTKDLVESPLMISKLDTNSSMTILYICMYGKSSTSYTSGLWSALFDMLLFIWF